MKPILASGLLLLSACSTLHKDVRVPPQQKSVPMEKKEITLHALSQPQSVLHTLGRPNLRYSEGKTILWQYQNASCVLEFFFIKDSSLKLRRVEARNRSNGRRLSSPETCFRSLRENANQKGGTS